MMNKCDLTAEQIVEELDVYTDFKLSKMINRREYKEVFAMIRKLAAEGKLPPEEEKVLRLYIRAARKYNLNGMRSGVYAPELNANPLQAFSVSGMTLPTLRVFDTILCRLGEQPEQERSVIIDVKELLSLYGMKEYNVDEFSNAVDNLFQTVTIDREDGGFKIIALFEKFVCDENTAEIVCTESARELLSANNVEYLHFRLDNAMKFTSRYSYMLFFYLVDRSVLEREWTVDIGELRDVLGYDLIDYVGSGLLGVLYESRIEIGEKTDLRFGFVPLFDEALGRDKITAIRFRIESISLPKKVEDNLIQLQNPD